MKKTIKVSGSESGFKTVALRKKRKKDVLAEGIDNRRVAAETSGARLWGSETGDITESKSIDMEEECLVEETSVDYGLCVKTKKVLEKPLGVIDYDTVNTDDDMLDDSFLLPPPLPIKPSIQMSVHKFFALDINLVTITGKSSQEKLSFIRKIFSSVNSFGGVSTSSKFGEIIRVTFTSEKAMMAAGKLANNHGVVVNTDLKCPVNNHTNQTIVLKEIPVRTSIEAVSVFGQIKMIKMQWLTSINRHEILGINLGCCSIFFLWEQWLMICKISLVLWVKKHACLNTTLLIILTQDVLLCVLLYLVTSLCSVCNSLSHSSLVCKSAGMSSIPKSKRASLSAQDKFRLAKIYKKKSAPVFRPLAFGGKTWVDVIGKSSFCALSGSPLLLGSVNSDKPIPLVGSVLEICLVSIESSLVDLMSQISELTKRLNLLIQEEDTVMRVGLDEATSNETATIVDFSASLHVVKLEKMLEGLSKSVLSLSAHFDMSILGLYTGASVAVWFSQANVINSLITRAVNESSFVVFGGDFNKDGTCRCATLNNVTMFANEFCASEKFSDLDAMWEIIRKIMVLLANKVFKKKWFRGFDEVFTKEFSRFHKLELLVSKIIKVSYGKDVECFNSLMRCWNSLDCDRASVIQSMITSGMNFGHVCSALLDVRKSYHASKLAKSQCAKDANIRSAIDKRMKSFKVNKGHTIRSMFKCLFCKVVLDHLVVDNELILEPDLVRSKVDIIMEGWTRKCWVVGSVSNDWCCQYHPLEYVFDEAFSGVMNSVSFDELFRVVSDLPDGKAASLLGISNKLLKHCDKLVLDMLLVLLNSCLTGESVPSPWKKAWVSMIPKPYE
ncbi:hypothetical protein G9A89_012526 [Geosiphon pyriformis]|nr:hypothetical protein G9A89_012526 [Geosiphon pyriformis]